MQCATHLAGIEPVAFTILSVSPVPEDHFTLGCIFHDCVPDTGTESSWQLSKATTLSSAMGILGRVPCTVVICERDLQLGS
jgi:hypothetical protein